MAGADLVGMPLEREGVVDAVAGPKRAVRRRVRIDGAARQGAPRQAIIAAERVRGHGGQEDLLAAIGAAIHQHDRFASDDFAVRRHRGPDPDIGVLAAQAGQHFLPPRVTSLTARPVLRVRSAATGSIVAIELQPETAADRRHGDAHGRRRRIRSLAVTFLTVQGTCVDVWIWNARPHRGNARARLEGHDGSDGRRGNCFRRS